MSRAEGPDLELEEAGRAVGRDRRVSVQLAPPYQQFPSSPCRISEGLGVRNTDHFTDRSLKMLQLISWGRSHCFTLCCTLSPSGNPTDLGPGWKLSSTKLTLFCESKRQGEHQWAARSSLGLLGQDWPGKPPAVPQEWARSPQPSHLAPTAHFNAETGSRSGTGCLLTMAWMYFACQVRSSALT